MKARDIRDRLQDIHISLLGSQLIVDETGYKKISPNLGLIFTFI